MKSSAKISDCGKYRYRLERIEDEKLPLCTFVMLNPSTADETVDDPTIKKCMNYARSWNCGGIVVVNLFAIRTKDPIEMKKSKDPIGEGNDEELLEALSKSPLTVCAWGNHGTHLNRSKEVRDLLAKNGIEAYCLNKTKKGEPGHPLYLSSKIQKKDLSKL